MAQPDYYIFDFDSTFIRVEALEELGAVSLQSNPSKGLILKELESLTRKGIEGEISFRKGLEQRISLIKANRSHLPSLVQRLKRKISPSIKRNQKFFRENKDRIRIISAGFREFIEPVVLGFGIEASQILANSFLYNKAGEIIGFEKGNPLSQTGGKFQALKNLNLKGNVWVVGDGYTDADMKRAGSNIRFSAFIENIIRNSAVEAADHISPNMDELLFSHKTKGALSYPKNRIKALLLEDIHPEAVKLFKEEGYQVQIHKGAMSESELIENIKDISILGIRSKTKITKKVLNAAPRLISVGAFCIGTNQIDLETCMDKGICVFNAPFSNTRSVVELVIGQLILLMRGIPEKNKRMHDGIWQKSAGNATEIRGKTLGIIGYGNIGSQLSVLAEGLGMKVCFYDKVDKLALGNASRCNSLKEVLKKSDVVTLHVDGNPDNENLITEKELSFMKQGAFLLNLSRGFVVDISALANALKKGKLSGASVDVFPYEPKTNDETFQSELIGLPNVILTPHIGGSTQEAQENIAHYVPGKIINYINSGSSFSSVNFPNIQLPELKKSHRLIHIHKNIPGVLASINLLLANHKINIEGQYLKTNENIGYVITDIFKKYDEKVLEKLKTIEGTIRFRVLY